MGVGEWLLAGLVAALFAFVILRPDLWGKRGRGSPRTDEDTAVGVHMDGRHHDHDGSDSDGDGGGDGGGGD
jgi:hypothetical protein